MTFTARDWLQLYDATKRQIVSKRQSGNRVSEKDSSALATNLKTLESQLKIMSSNLMEYEIATSEIARRQTLIDNLNKQALYVLAPRGGAETSASVSGGAVALNPMQTSDKGPNMLLREDLSSFFRSYSKTTRSHEGSGRNACRYQQRCRQTSWTGINISYFKEYCFSISRQKPLEKKQKLITDYSLVLKVCTPLSGCGVELCLVCRAC
jgi:hypothetical protein